MSIFFPANKKRKARLLELSTDTHNFLHHAKTDYEQFKSLNTQINEKITQVYKKAGLTPPPTKTIDILKAAGATHEIETADTAVEITDILVDVAGLAATIQYLAPGATSLLVETGAMEAETAATVLGTVLGTEITAGTLAGGLLGGLLAGVVIVGIGLAIDAIEGAILRDKLRDGIHKMDQIRASTKLSLDKAEKLVSVLKSVKRTLDSLISSDIPLSDQLLRNLITKDAKPAIDAVNAITISTVRVELNKLDHSRNSWTIEDIVPHDIYSHPEKNTFLIVQVSAKSHPTIPSGLKITCLSRPDALQSSSTCPIVQSGGYTYWSYSYIDNRESMAIVAYDSAGNVVKQWNKDGARYIVEIISDPITNKVIFVGQSSRKIIMTWDELGSLPTPVKNIDLGV